MEASQAGGRIHALSGDGAAVGPSPCLGRVAGCASSVVGRKWGGTQHSVVLTLLQGGSPQAPGSRIRGDHLRHGAAASMHQQPTKRGAGWGCLIQQAGTTCHWGTQSTHTTKRRRHLPSCQRSHKHHSVVLDARNKAQMNQYVLAAPSSTRTTQARPGDASTQLTEVRTMRPGHTHRHTQAAAAAHTCSGCAACAANQPLRRRSVSSAIGAL